LDRFRASLGHGAQSRLSTFARSFYAKFGTGNRVNVAPGRYDVRPLTVYSSELGQRIGAPRYQTANHTTLRFDIFCLFLTRFLNSDKELVLLGTKRPIIQRFVASFLKWEKELLSKENHHMCQTNNLRSSKMQAHNTNQAGSKRHAKQVTHRAEIILTPMSNKELAAHPGRIQVCDRSVGEERLDAGELTTLFVSQKTTMTLQTRMMSGFKSKCGTMSCSTKS
jgi:hypothetical protein